MTPGTDWRHLPTGLPLPWVRYCDRPAFVVTDDQAWLIVCTVGVGREGDSGTHVVASRSSDQGLTWTTPVGIEPSGPPESAWAVPLKVPGGRLYVFYICNHHGLRQIPTDCGVVTRMDMVGELAFRYSDDHGRTWSAQRHLVPVRPFRLDRENVYQGRTRFLRLAAKPVVVGDAVFLPLSKIGRFGESFVAHSEVAFVRSPNLLRERDPARLQWETLPAGDMGLSAPVGTIAEAASLVAADAGALYCLARGTDGCLWQATSRDAGLTWSPLAPATFGPGGRPLKNPRAAPLLCRCRNGRYLLAWHRHAGHDYQDRNPLWLSGGLACGGVIHWSQPELVLYDSDPGTRISYPDFLEDGDRAFLLTTDKTLARVHEVDPDLLDMLWRQLELAELAPEGLALQVSADAIRAQEVQDLPELPALDSHQGFSLDCWVRFADLDPAQVILDTRLDSGVGLLLATSDSGTLKLSLNDGAREEAWDCDQGVLAADRWHHVGIIVDGGPRLVSFVVDGQLGDGGALRQFGWGRLCRYLGDCNGESGALIAPHFRGELRVFRYYARPLRVSELVGNYRAGLPAA